MDVYLSMFKGTDVHDRNMYKHDAFLLGAGMVSSIQR